MAAPMKNLFLSKVCRFLRVARIAKDNIVPITSLEKTIHGDRLKYACDVSEKSLFSTVRRLVLNWQQHPAAVKNVKIENIAPAQCKHVTPSNVNSRDPERITERCPCSNYSSSNHHVKFAAKFTPQSQSQTNCFPVSSKMTPALAMCRQFSTSKGLHADDSGDDPSPSSRPLRLMNIRERIWPHPIKSIRNWFMSFLIAGYMDKGFTQKFFLEGAEQAVSVVSGLISSGRFDELDGLVDREAIAEIRHNYNVLNAKQRQMLAVNSKDIFFRFVYEIGMIFDDQSEKRFVEITTVFQGYHGLANMQARGEDPGDLSANMEKAGDNMYVCNYRFIREYTKGVSDSSEWTINKLNHFAPKDIVKNTSIFHR